MSNLSDALALVREYSALQQKLCSKLASHHSPYDDAMVLTLSKKGVIVVDGDSWTFRPHGMGVSFNRTSDNRCIDAHIYPFSQPSAVDSWRLLPYFESLGVDVVHLDGVWLPVKKESGVKKLLELLCERGFLCIMDRDRAIYTPV